MRRLGRLGSLAATMLMVAGAAAGCGDDDGVRGVPNPDPGDSVRGLAPQLIDILSATAAGGDADRVAVVLSGDGLRQFTRQFRGPRLAGEIRQWVGATEVPNGMALVAAVVSIGCDVPSDVTTQSEGVKVTIKPVWTGVDRHEECFAPVTSVALVLVDRDWVVGSL